MVDIRIKRLAAVYPLCGSAHRKVTMIGVAVRGGSTRFSFS
jgi:hypothetical protein